MARSAISTTNTRTLDCVIEQLAQQSVVDGIIVVGSAATAQMTAASDYDLVLILAEMPVPLHTGVTYIDGRFTDLLFHATAEVDTILAATTPFDLWDWTGRLVGWLEAGQIRFDRHGTLIRAQTKVRNGDWLTSDNERAIYGAWQTINYNLAVVRRYLASDDPAYLEAADLRMALYAPQDLYWNYFTVRNLRPDSDKAQLAYLRTHDPAFLAAYQRFLVEPNRAKKFRLYTTLAAQVLAPVGSLWQAGETVLNLSAPSVTIALEEEALAFWETLLH